MGPSQISDTPFQGYVNVLSVNLGFSQSLIYIYIHTYINHHKRTYIYIYPGLYPSQSGFADLFLSRNLRSPGEAPMPPAEEAGNGLGLARSGQ